MKSSVYCNQTAFCATSFHSRKFWYLGYLFGKANLCLPRPGLHKRTFKLGFACSNHADQCQLVFFHNGTSCMFAIDTHEKVV